MTKPSDSGSTEIRRAALCLAAIVGVGISFSFVAAEVQTDERKHVSGGQKIVLTTADGIQARATLLDNARARTFAAKLGFREVWRTPSR